MIATALAAMLAQAMPGMTMPGMAMPPPPNAETHAAPAPLAGARPSAPPPGFYADRQFGGAAMARARAVLRREHGGGRFGLVDVPLLEVQARDGRDGYEWTGEAWYGGDRHRLVVKSEGRGTFGASPEQAEAQLLYATPIDPYWTLQLGARHDFAGGAKRTHAVIAAEGLAPYWIELEASLFVSDRGDVTARIEAMHDARITQALVLQPRIELNLAAQDVPQARIGAGATEAELGLRLRYEIVREFAPYLGIQHERRFGETRRLAHAAGRSTSLVVGVATFF